MPESAARQAVRELRRSSRLRQPSCPASRRRFAVDLE